MVETPKSGRTYEGYSAIQAIAVGVADHVLIKNIMGGSSNKMTEQETLTRENFIMSTLTTAGAVVGGNAAATQVEIESNFPSPKKQDCLKQKKNIVLYTFLVKNISESLFLLTEPERR